MRFLQVMLLLLTLFSSVVGLSYILEGEFVFGLIVLLFSAVFAFGLLERGGASFSFRVAHLYVGSILLLLASGYRLLSFAASLLNLLTGEEPSWLGLSDSLLILVSLPALFGFWTVRRALRSDTESRFVRRDGRMANSEEGDFPTNG